MNTDKRRQLEAAYQKILDIFAIAIPPEEAAHLFSDHLSAWGTLTAEKVIGPDGFIEFIRKQNQQAATGDMKIEVERHPFASHFLEGGNIVVLVDDLSVNVYAGEEKVVHPLRLTTVWEFGSGNWKMIHLHASRGVNANVEQDGWLVEEWKRKQAELEKLVAEKTAELTQRNRELEVEAALERVRFKAAEIKESSEVSQVVRAIYRELHKLEVTNATTDVEIYIIEEATGMGTIWGTEANLTSKMQRFSMPLLQHPQLKNEYRQWKNTPPGDRKDLLLNCEYRGELLESTVQFLASIPELEEAVRAFKAAGIKQWFTHNAYFSHGMISLQGVHPAPEKVQGLLQRFAKVFEQAYIRFLDLQRAEQQAETIRLEKEHLEKALQDLRATQTQLIQQEKLASLGQLTAGIAHEIKNPLNFVNNFSEVSRELLDELQDAIRQSDWEEVKAIASDLNQNLQKIQEHGARADGIVRSMLLHSRGGSGQKTTADLNAIVKEYVNLAFHGMRAGKHPINVSIDLDLDDQIGDVALMVEDFSRVILNLCNNAFDAMRSKMEAPDTPGDYLPHLHVTTVPLENGGVTLSISDNGPGIPPGLRDKILQPFFTTKKGAEGTGLGLSISNDIVKAHGGSMEVRSEEGQGSTFVITLPGGP